LKALAEALLGRRWAAPFLKEIDRGRFAVKDVSIESVRAVALHQDRQLDALVRKHWGNLAPATPEVKLAEVRRLNNDLRAGPGDTLRGRELFTKHCATCHRLFDQGGTVGPDLTHANHKDRDYLLVSTVDPSTVVRKSTSQPCADEGWSRSDGLDRGADGRPADAARQQERANCPTAGPS
jgi:mono/diheme cytochrome c family protein